MDAAEGELRGSQRGGRFHGYTAPKRNSSFSTSQRRNYSAGDDMMDSSVNNQQNDVAFDDRVASRSMDRSMVDIFLSEDPNTNPTAAAAMEEYFPKSSGEVDPIKKCLFYTCVVIAFVIIFITVPHRGGSKEEEVGDTTLAPTMAPTMAESIFIEEEVEIPNKPSNNNNNEEKGKEEEATEEEEEEEESTPEEETGATMTRTEAMEAFILEMAVSTAEHLSDQTSAAYKAMEWIANEDPTNSDIPGYEFNNYDVDTQSLSSLLLLQKYALKTFQFALDAFDQNEGRRLQEEEEETDEVNNRMQLDETWNYKENVCDWYGVTCNGRGFVTELHLSHSLLQGTLVPEIFQEQAMLELVYLDLSFNKFKGTFPSQTIVNYALKELWIDHNHLEGTIDNIIGPFSNLIQLDLQDNKFTGTLPTQWSHMTKLEVLKLAANHLQGTIPKEMGDMTSMEWFQMNVNKLTGKIPTELAKMKHLHTLRVANNHLTGTLPLFLADLPMTHISVEINKLTGEVPAAFGKMSLLEDLHLQQNFLEGTIPKEVCALTTDGDQALQKLTADCKDPVIECSCCTTCY